MATIVIIGAGGLAKRVIDIIERTPGQQLAGLIAADRTVGEQVFGYPVLGDDARLAEVIAGHGIDAAVVAIGDNWQRARVVRTALSAVPGLRFASAIDPSAQVARGAAIGRGAVIAARVVLDSDARVGDFALIHIGATVSHDVTVGAFASVGLHAVACGAARIGDYAAIGVGANVIQRVSVGEHTVIGAGSTVVRDMPAYAVAYGSPARVVRQRQAGDPYL